MERLFSRASNIIREAAELQGAVFFDASANPTYTADDMSSRDKSSSTLSSTTGLVVCGGLVVSATYWAIPRAPSRASPKTVQHRPPAYQKTLQLFLRRYPRGTVFAFDRDGVISSSEEEPLRIQPVAYEQASAFVRKESGSAYAKKQRRQDAATILELIPGVRSVAFVPLWDYHREHWFAAALAWSVDPNRTLDEEDLAYLVAFGNSVMAEVSRLEAVIANRKKSDFISSISHEMRSPLHGVLGNTELLRGMATTPSQNEAIDMVEVCGRTMLDTVDHLLDYAKITTYI